MISFSPTEEQKMIVNTVKQFATDVMRKKYRECDEAGEIPADIINAAWELGLVISCIPEEHGGAGWDHSALTGALLAEELAWGDLSMAMHILAPSLAILPIVEAGTAEQKKKYLPTLCGAKFSTATAAFIEPRYNFDPTEFGTTARKSGGYTLNGEKCYVPLAADAGFILVYAGEGGSNQCFIVDKGTKGLEIGEREKNMGIKALATYELTLKNCKVPAENRLGGSAGCDCKRLANLSRVALAAMAVGVARGSFEFSRDYAKERYAFGEPIAARQAIAFMLADMAIEVDAARLLNWEAAWKLDKKEDATREACLAKMYADNMAMLVTDYGVQVMGGHGYVRDNPVELWFRNGRGFTAFTGMAIV
ncbi:MAG: acyl-CoA dehydrogenase family protein [Dehalococcoidia bacterium]|nr:acyl-CoA dehydrogenase family protein [Dehalococcoidia bacterium]MDD5494542.1 acyl-CoA dehydrogenase family protein [Dehalococcoidia bacterium]